MSIPLIPDPNTISRIEPREEVPQREPVSVTIEPRREPTQDNAQSRGDGPSEHPN